jgi:hypothetical protein
MSAMKLTDETIRTALSDIEATPDLLEKALKLAGLVSCLFREQGFPLVVVGGSAVEFYTEGAYMSGDIDFCRQTLTPIPLRLSQEIMGKLDAAGGPRSWKAAGLFVDLLGLLENESKKSCTVLQTPYGPVTLIPPEMILVERVLAAVYPARNQEQYDVAKKMMVSGLSKDAAFDWSEAERLAALPAFQVLRELQELKTEVQRELETER